MELRRTDVNLLDRAKIQAEVMIPRCARLGFLLVWDADAPIAEGLGMALTREHTLMPGSDRCDFRYVVDPED